MLKLRKAPRLAGKNLLIAGTAQQQIRHHRYAKGLLDPSLFPSLGGGKVLRASWTYHDHRQPRCAKGTSDYAMGIPAVLFFHILVSTLICMASWI
jgi:hypothetical protein